MPNPPTIRLTIDELAEHAYAAGFRGWGLAVAIAIAHAESNFWEDWESLPNPDGSIDRGLWQINGKFHPEVSIPCALDGTCAAREVYRISNQGTDWHQWSTYSISPPRYLQFFNEAQEIADTTEYWHWILDTYGPEEYMRLRFQWVGPLVNPPQYGDYPYSQGSYYPWYQYLQPYSYYSDPWHPYIYPYSGLFYGGYYSPYYYPYWQYS